MCDVEVGKLLYRIVHFIKVMQLGVQIINGRDVHFQAL